MNSILVSHPLGSEVVRALIKELVSHQRLHSFYTSVNIPSDSPWLRVLPQRISEDLLRRSYPVDRNYIHAHPVREIVRQVSIRAQWSTLIQHETGWACVDRVFHDVDQWVAASINRVKELPEWILAYEDGASSTFEVARRLGIHTVYDLPIGHYAAAQRIMREEAELFPAFASSIEALNDSPAKLRRKDQELERADIVLAGSQFVKTTLLEAGISDSKIHVLKFGSSPGPVPEKKSFKPSSPLRLLFAGRIGQRKGIGYLLEAMKKLDRKDIQLTLLGQLLGEASIYSPYADYFTHQPPVPYDRMLEIMRNSDALVLPTLFEGQALVILAAMKCGIPVITTSHSGADHLVTEGQEGFIVPIRSVEKLCEKIAWLADNRERALEMGRAAYQTSLSCTWTQYTDGFLRTLDQYK